MWSQFRFGWVIALCSLMFGCTSLTPAPVSGLNKDYHSIPRGSYRGSYYQVKKGDTLYFISYITDKDVNDIIRYNQLQPPYTIHPGQKIRLWQPAYTPPAYGGTGAGAIVSTASAASNVKKTVVVPPPIPSVSKTTNPVSTSQNHKKTASSVSKTSPKSIDQGKTKGYVGGESKINVNNKVVTKPKQSNDKIAKWLWPTKGRVIKNFSAGDQGNKGIDIAGQRGQSIISTAAGTVVYSGNALRGYGNLIIIKHNDHYLSAYAHNDQLLVKEGQSIKAGQKIATMGSSGTNSVRLHFEIRYQGKPVNPQRYLP
ncbi:murein hydrolase activator NlpD [Vibrio sp. V27_P1S3P104]|uniref:murein hydrolase activator NlpD n=1 Tax=unclassified Vibrio TaxID=2614977 RepID=UPI0013733D4C|nr:MULTISPECIES: murein hydrolase activator NlpD [unclassified Vibrio]NAW69952.1 murein hydrolase activator NlpD [Vibrio sp. V28_P6S34P95]NAX05362.1 murein hydrolase activator NlpD [Vibrio sp. V30_P3S12P165]NAX33850.1 murein hydrolase activator NlpD [Vibrio sp. V29_P1S30P107]NAX37037.1 murein hydrolase activator NlpD [Vibrio sp. V27_P1S3P104]NAX39746.1 murein hydrolase activator NlpD [Vibrio sp. V26_P1S5P106]